MVDLRLLLCLVLLNSIDQSGRVVGQFMSCGQHVTGREDLIEDTDIVMSISHPLMPSELELVPRLEYDVLLSSSRPDVGLVGFYLTTLVNQENDTDVTDERWTSSLNATCPLNAAEYNLPITVTWSSPEQVDACVTLRFGILFNSSAKQVISTTLCKPTGCSNYTTSESGIVTSPKFPSAYPDDANCSFYIIANKGEIIDLQFQYLDLERPYSLRCFDYVEVYYNNLTSGPFCGNFTREGLKQLRYLAEGFLRIRFISDNKLNSNGFRAVHRIAGLKDCSRSLYNVSGNISSPSFPQNYFPNVRCVTRIVLPSNYRILIKMTDLDLESGVGGDCVYDRVHIYDSLLNTPGKSWCGSIENYPKHELRYESSASVVTVNFESDNLNEYRGFHLTYLGVPSCHNETFSVGNGTLASVNYPSHYPNGQECFYTISISDDMENIELTFEMLNTESDNDVRYRNHLCNKDYVEVFDGRVSHRVCGNWSGQEHLLMFRSAGNSLVFKFVSDEQTTRPGFYAKWRTVKNRGDLPCISTWLDTGSSCFEIIYQKQTWNDSDIDCRSRGGHLATITDLATELLLSKHLKNSNCTRKDDAFWVGASDQVYESDFYWTDGSKVQFSDWFEGWAQYSFANQQPSDDGLAQEDCIELRRTFNYPYKGQGTTTDYRWNDRNCRVKNPYVCQCYRNGNKPPPKADPPSCDQMVILSSEISSVTMTSPGYPNDYPNFIDCRITVLAPRKRILVVDFSDLNLEQSKNCEYDFLRVSMFPENSSFDENTTRFCGNWSRKPKLLRTLIPSNAVFLHFSSDHSFRFRGFNATVSLANESDECETWIQAEDTCLIPSAIPVSSAEAEVVCQRFDDFRLLLTASLMDIFLVASHVGSNGSEEVRLWYDIQNSSCRAATVNLTDIYGGQFVPNGVHIEEVSCEDTLHAVCYRNKTDSRDGHVVNVITDSHGDLSTEGYPSVRYNDNTKQTWRFEAVNGSRILFTLFYLDLEYQDDCLYDFLEFMYTLPEGRFCGNSNVKRHFLSRDHKADVTLESDYGFSGRGFNLSWMQVDMEECTHKVLTDEQGNISSLNFPFAFPDLMHCKTIIEVCKECRVFIEIDELVLPEGYENYLEVFIGGKSSLTFRNSTFRRVMPLRLLSKFSTMTLTFKANSLPENFGFRGTYKQLKSPVTVPTEIIDVRPNVRTFITSLNSPLPYPSAISQRTIFRAPIGHTISLTFDAVKLEPSKDCSGDVVTVTDVSIGNSEKRLSTLCSDRANNTNITTAAVVSIYNRLELYFVSAEEFTTAARGYSAVIETTEDPAYMNKTATLGGATFDSCEEDPCTNGGTCNQISRSEAKCACPGYYTGLFCQVTYCQISPCIHGLCVLTNTSYFCNCTPGYWGPNCLHTTSACRSYFCGGKGNCVGNNTKTPSCNCDNFWEGPQCRNPMADSRMSVAIGQRLLGEPIWIGLIVILSVLLAFGIFYVIRRKFGKHFTCCDITIKKEEKTDAKTNPSETPTPLIIQSSFSAKKARRCSIPPPLTAPPIIAITKAEDSCSSTPGYNRRTGDVAARFFASYKEAERTPISAPVAVDFNKTTATSMASDSDDNSIVGGLVGGTLAFAGSRLQNEEIRRSEANKMLRTTSFLQTPCPSSMGNKEKMKRSHSTGPFLVRQASLYDDMALSQRSLSTGEPSTDHFFPTVIITNETRSNVDEDENSSIQIFLDEPAEETLEGAVGPNRQMSKSDGSVHSTSLRHKVSSWRSVAIDDCQSHSELTRKERAKNFSRSASVDQLKEQRVNECRSRSRSEMNSFESGISCDCSRCRRKHCTDADSSSKSRSSSCRYHRETDSLNQSCSCDGERHQGRFRHGKKRHHKSHRKLYSCSSIGHSHISSKPMTRASSTESEQYKRKSYANHKRAKSSSKRSSKRDILKALDVENGERDNDYARKELFVKFFSQEVQYSSENNAANDEENVFKFPEPSGQTDKTSDTVEGSLKTSDRGNKGATCNVIIYNCSARENSRQVNINRNDIVEKSFSLEEDCVLPKYENDDSAICSSEATTSSDSFKSHKEEKKVLNASSSLLTVTTDTDSALSSAPKSFQASPYHDPYFITQTTFIHDMKVKDSAYQTKQSSVDVGILSNDVVLPTERPGEVKRKLSLPTTKSEESHVTQRLHQAACKLFLLQQRVRRNRFSKDSAVHTISEDEYHQLDLDEEGGTDLFHHRRFVRGQIFPLRHLDHLGSVRNDKGRPSVELKSTATPVSDADQGSEVGEISV